MTTLEEFKDRLTAAQPSLKVWGDFVREAVKAISKSEGITLQILSGRVKEIDSAIGKLSRKPYKNPMSDMTDLVGVRAVCLLSPDVDRLCASLMLHPEWKIQKSRDTSKEYEQAPEKFGYQSHHFEVRAKIDFDIDGVVVPADTCCELQVRTLMQHAYAEVVHDSIYKSSWGAPTRAIRFVSSSAALIETADHLFCETMNILELETKSRGELLEQLTGLYDSKIKVKGFKDQKFNMMVLEELKDFIDDNTLPKLSDFLNERSYIADRVSSRINSDVFWSQPVSMLAYLLVHDHLYLIKEAWPFSESEDALAMVYSDLGKKFAN
ncbi:GTP pyrophosphokinase [Pseudomonas extremaustralis]|uniref:PpGpp synthetase catalytic domain-containing protein (RelA/SpoT-type nucleotidyltranferase) n=1 Tax=Pseudomonas extremaustralis TaxID=359110 RepID=A0A5C5QPE6_9PSED|nr:RelA/SpoT domain-containing protein [Pseudomonas extremaustralis]EZI29591.1 hypothetical protein PE143B_0104030 [Pseudomonas extremaustralis 14-3 substr. 14-3b]TWS07049.1 hypothetical protein FIV36_03790 [Pseudomonas extremaustralis]SDF89850.1 ppGpp synthetase catalytic domain-containing protein (RelA/SpoT-type nucleotidyltranferase) [Pseudomonas extremaustralis]